MRIYIAGPMRGLPDNNFPAFDAARKLWEQAGHTVLCPAQLARALPYVVEQGEPHNGPEARHHLEHVALADVLCVTKAEAIVLLPGWENSRGATMELATAQFLGLPLFCAVSMQELFPPMKPWGFLRELLPAGREV